MAEASMPTAPKSKGKKRNNKDGGEGTKRRKVSLACVYCRRSHMTCDESRPCQRCVRRGIGHLCHDRPMNSGDASQPTDATLQEPAQPSPPPAAATTPVPPVPPVPAAPSVPTPMAAWTNMMGFAPQPAQWPPVPQPAGSPLTSDAANRWAYPPTGLAQPPVPHPDSVTPAPAPAPVPPARNPSWWGMNPAAQQWEGPIPEASATEYQMLSDFLDSLNSAMGYQGYSPQEQQGAGAAPTPAASTSAAAAHEPPGRGMSLGAGSALDNPAPDARSMYPFPRASSSSALPPSRPNNPASRASAPVGLPATESSTNYQTHTDGPPDLPWASKTEQFIMTAADQHDGTRESRLGRVIRAKHDAGLLKPYNHVKGYARLLKWMECNVSADSRRRILQPLSVFRPAFRAVAQRLTDIDLIYIEEAFERLLLDYDRVFASQGIPACLWRRTGEIYKANKEFAELIGVSIDALREGRLCIYELMAEESAVNYWERYGAVSFDPGQKAVLTTCVLKVRRPPRQRSTVPVARQIAAQLPISAQAQSTLNPGSTNGSGSGSSGTNSVNAVPPPPSIKGNNQPGPSSKNSSPVAVREPAANLAEDASGHARRRSSAYSASAGLAPWKMTPTESRPADEPTLSSSAAAADTAHSGVTSDPSTSTVPAAGPAQLAASAGLGPSASAALAPAPAPAQQPFRRTAEGLFELKCCFSFTIRRDQWNIPTMVVGNFLPFDPS